MLKENVWCWTWHIITNYSFVFRLESKKIYIFLNSSSFNILLFQVTRQSPLLMEICSLMQIVKWNLTNANIDSNFSVKFNKAYSKSRQKIFCVNNIRKYLYKRSQYRFKENPRQIFMNLIFSVLLSVYDMIPRYLRHFTLDWIPPITELIQNWIHSTGNLTKKEQKLYKWAIFPLTCSSLLSFSFLLINNRSWCLENEIVRHSYKIISVKWNYYYKFWEFDLWAHAFYSIYYMFGQESGNLQNLLSLNY